MHFIKKKTFYRIKTVVLFSLYYFNIPLLNSIYHVWRFNLPIFYIIYRVIFTLEPFSLPKFHFIYWDILCTFILCKNRYETYTLFKKSCQIVYFCLIKRKKTLILTKKSDFLVKNQCF